MRHSSAPREGEDKKKGGKERRSSLSGSVGSVCRRGGPVQLATSASHTYRTSLLSRKAYTASLTAARHASVPGVGGDTAPTSASGGLQEGAGENEGAALPPPSDPAEELLKE